ncbi:hypothetical protein LTR10_014788 [Elasticomyces elasticus]|uniref:NmrA-like domain-containing protein n=1 Tax=Exophiala sideris TaxID=1016849 RepID=A0ABR0JGB5_9EURO|nr:hypothetical protein LTR10_014788 [Elasticomyces elasticus]KAK5025631.1 hypothetical protein LTS07_007835 [Exophiala sideris]KAK5063644.1 hypothetical protein LTR69_004350 [Exophiala sideris]KAK5180522.1 hypothetical protein LTR44_006836 [Eurotiomycetes sp. CCFEE 6388]
MTEALLKTGKHTVTAITRLDSQSPLPDGVTTRKVDYEKPETLVEALRGQDALVITLSGRSQIQQIEEKLVRAAAEAGVPWILPNEWSPDTANEDVVNDVFILKSKVATRNLIEELGKSSYIAVVTGFWYEWSLALPHGFGIDLVNHNATFYDEGETKISTTTWPQIGRAVGALLSLPVKAEDTDGEACLEHLRNKVVYINSFTVSQKDMLDSARRVTGTTESDWTITKEPSRERYASGVQEWKDGKYIGLAKILYTRIFYPDGCGDFEHKGTLNSMLALPQEDIDEATNVALERAKIGNQWG